MSALVKTLHPDEKITAGKLGSSMVKAGIGLAVVFLGLSLVLVLARGTAEAGHASKWARFLYAYVTGWCFIATIPIGMLWIILLHFLVRGH